jgi:carbonic anhydrase
MRLLKELFENNARWAAGMEEARPGFFEKLANQQTPQFLWIGCADSRVPATDITGLLPGEIFVHRNIANVVRAPDVNCLAVLQYAVEVLRVKHVIVTGHYRCGGVGAVLESGRPPVLVDAWLEPVREIARQHRKALEAIAASDERWRRLCELNVVEQAASAAQTPVVQEAWARGQELAVHGWIYDVHDGRLRDLGVTVENAPEAAAVREGAVAAVLRQESGN